MILITGIFANYTIYCFTYYLTLLNTKVHPLSVSYDNVQRSFGAHTLYIGKQCYNVATCQIYDEINGVGNGFVRDDEIFASIATFHMEFPIDRPNATMKYLIAPPCDTLLKWSSLHCN